MSYCSTLFAVMTGLKPVLVDLENTSTLSFEEIKKK